MIDHLEIIARIRNCVPQYYDRDEGLIVSSRNRIYRIEDLNRPQLDEIARVPWSLKHRASYFRLVDRVVKNSVYLVHRTSKGSYLVAAGKNWWHVSPDGHQEPVRLPSPTKPLSRGICNGVSGKIYVGDYTRNSDRGPVRVWRSTDFTNFVPAWEFPSGSIRHIHALISDPEQPRIWLLTGDKNHESKFWFTDDEFNSVHEFLSLGQMSRAADLIIQNGRLLWAMDAPDESSYILMKTKSDDSSPQKLFKLPGPAYFSARNEKGGVYFGTTAEPGDAVTDDSVHLIGLRKDGSWRDIYQARTDWIPQYAILYFPAGILPGNWIVFRQRATRRHEGYMIIARDKDYRGTNT